MSEPRPTFLLTFDTELFWGLFFLPEFADREAEMAEVRPALASILRILGEREIRATFAVVGRLFLAGPDDVDEAALPRPDGEAPGGDWYARVPPPGDPRAPAWWGRDVVDAIRAAPGRPAAAGHEIAGHGFGHADFDRFDAVRATAEVRATVDAAVRAGCPAPRSWVFPRNRVAHEAALAVNGIRVWRDAPAPRSRARRFLDQLVAGGPLVASPRPSPLGLVIAPPGVALLPADGMRRLLTRARRRALYRAGIERALAESATFHVWTHPHNFVRRRDVMLGTLEDLADAVAAARDRDGLRVATMGDLAP